jgi:shikimate O-hydroxycinnamoyltransferase
MHHMLVDGRSAFHFMETWSSIACGDDSDTMPPFFDHTLLCARPEPKVLFDHMAYNSNRTSTIPPPGSSTRYAISVQEISNKQIAALKLRCKDTDAGARLSTFCAVTALVWRCFCMARKLDTQSQSNLYTMIDMRNRMVPPLPPTYFGNAVIRTSVSELVHDIISGPISKVAKRVHEVTKKGDDYARSLIDYLETAGTGDLPRSGFPITELRVISWLGMPTLNADLGWGKPIFLAPAYYSGYVFLMDSLSKDGAVSIVVSLEPESMPEFEKLFLKLVAALDV